MAEIDQDMDQTSEFETWWNDPEVKAAREAFSKAMDNAKEQLENNLTSDMISDIREWRCDQDYTWRAVAREFYDKYEDFSKLYGVDSGNQISGMMLCEIAQKLLKQKTSEGWN